MNQIVDLTKLPNLPKEVSKQFLAEPKADIEDALSKFILDYVDKQTRKKHREELLNNPSPIVAKWAGAFAKVDGSQWTDEEIDKTKDDYLTEKYGM